MTIASGKSAFKAEDDISKVVYPFNPLDVVEVEGAISPFGRSICAISGR